MSWSSGYAKGRVGSLCVCGGTSVLFLGMAAMANAQMIDTIAGGGSQGNSGDGGPAALAGTGYPIAIAADASGNLYVSDSSRVRKIDSAGVITRIAGTGTSSGGDG